MIVRTQKLKILVILRDSKDFIIEQYFPEFDHIFSSLSYGILDKQLLIIDEQLQQMQMSSWWVINKDAPHKLLKIRWLKYADNGSGQSNRQTAYKIDSFVKKLTHFS